MEEKNEGKKKESIDEILADLNGLLNKMPAMLEGIQLPEIKPVDLSGAWKEEPALPAPGAAPVPAENDKMVLQSLGEFMFSPDSPAEPESPARSHPFQAEPLAYPVQPAGLDAAPQLPEIKPVDPAPPPAEVSPELPVYDPETLKEEEAAIENAFKQEPEWGHLAARCPQEEAAPASRFEGTRDFGVPDIDALIKLSQEEAVPETGPGAAPGPDFENLTVEPAVPAAGEEGGAMDLKKDDSGNEEGSKPPQDDAESTISAQPGPLGLDAQGTEAAAGDSMRNTVPEPGEPGPLKSEELVLEIPESAASVPPPAGQEADPSSAREFSLKEIEPAPEEPGLIIEPAHSAFGSDSAPAPADDDKTMVIQPFSGGAEQDKTVIYQAGTDPGVTSRRREDLESLAAKAAPEGIPPERVRTVAFLYAAEDAALAAEMLAELDAICLKSSAKPMFMKRAFVQVCEPGSNGNVVMQKVTDSAACGLVCVGNVPPENVFEIENVFTAGGVFFRHLPRESFNHSAALDLVTELILK